jgi:Uma2 family endonuclease
MPARTRATIDDLYRIKGKAELVNGEIVMMEPTGEWPGHVAFRIASSLQQHEDRTRSGYAFGDNTGFVVDLPNRRSFSPDAAWHVGELRGMKFLEGTSAFAVGARSEGDYGPQAEEAIAEKRRDYFAAGTLCVWDVDLLSDDVVTACHISDPGHPVIFHRGDIVDAGDAVSGWSIPVDALLR